METPTEIGEMMYLTIGLYEWAKWALCSKVPCNEMKWKSKGLSGILFKGKYGLLRLLCLSSSGLPGKWLWWLDIQHPFERWGDWEMKPSVGDTGIEIWRTHGIAMTALNDPLSDFCYIRNNPLKNHYLGFISHRPPKIILIYKASHIEIPDKWFIKSVVLTKGNTVPRYVW